MEKTIMGLVAVIGAAAPLAGAHAAVVTTDDAMRALQVHSIAELLEPTANATAVLAALDAAPKETTTPFTADRLKGVKVAQWHHHHHHHYHHHHHHHYYHHHHHHHWHRPGCVPTPVGWVCP